MAVEFDYNMQLGGLQQNNLKTRENEREDAKAKRISQQNTEQSKLINQRKNNFDHPGIPVVLVSGALI